MTRVGFIGLGEMGLPMALNLIARGFDVTGYDIRPEAVRAFEAAGGRAAASSREAARAADATVVMVRTPQQAEDVLLGPAGGIAAARSDAVLIVMSTVGVATMQRLGTAARQRGLAFLDAPVSGGRARAEAGTLTVIVGGSHRDLATARPVLGAMGSQIEHVGEVGAGTAVKMANQVLLTISLLAAREAADLAAAQNVGTERLWEVLRSCTGTTWVVENWPTVAGWLRDYRPGSSLDILVKDTALALEQAQEIGLSARFVPLAAEMIRELTRSLAGGAAGPPAAQPPR
jgi:3-hydroxyisobutyrate dehydrogenase-like beta-hydroxyacid dehydrogenase